MQTTFALAAVAAFASASKLGLDTRAALNSAMEDIDENSAVHIYMGDVYNVAGNIVSTNGAPSFKFFPQKLDWFDARSVCVSLGGDLASIHSEEETAAISAILPSADWYSYAWIGMQDVIENGEWLWCDGTPMDYENHNDGNNH